MKKIIFILVALFSVMFIHAQNSAGTIEATTNATPIMLDHVQKINDPSKTKDTVLAPPAFVSTILLLLPDNVPPSLNASVFVFAVLAKIEL